MSDTKAVKVIPKYTQLNLIADVWEPKYSTNEVIIAKHKITRSKLDIHLKFKDVNPTSDYYGDWFISRKEAISRKTFNNNGLACVVIPFHKFQKFVRGRDEREMW